MWASLAGGSGLRQHMALRACTQSINGLRGARMLRSQMTVADELKRRKRAISLVFWDFVEVRHARQCWRAPGLAPCNALVPPPARSMHPLIPPSLPLPRPPSLPFSIHHAKDD